MDFSYKHRINATLYKFNRRVFPRAINSKMLYSYLKLKKVDIGENTVFFDASNVCIDITRPELLHIGNYCKITSGVVILTHDYSRSVIRRVYGEIINEAQETIIEDNVFIGMNAVLLMGTHVAENSIIGAGSVCHGHYPANSVIAGNPAKVISTLEKFYEKRKANYVEEAKHYYNVLRKSKNRIPTINEMGAFFPLYLKRELSELRKHRLRTNLSGDNEEEVIDDFLKTFPIFSSYEEFKKEAEDYASK